MSKTYKPGTYLKGLMTETEVDDDVAYGNVQYRYLLEQNGYYYIEYNSGEASDKWEVVTDKQLRQDFGYNPFTEGGPPSQTDINILKLMTDVDYMVCMSDLGIL